MLLSCPDTLALQWVLVSDKLDKKLPSSVTTVISQVDISDIFTDYKKTQGRTQQPVINKPKPAEDN